MQYQELTNAGKALKYDSEICVLTSGDSMRPMLRQHRDVVVIKRIDQSLKKGDVVLYPGQKGKYILHRIVAFKNGRCIIRGDNNYFTETDVKTDEIIGILKEFYRNGKYINCETSKKYKIYSFYILNSYFVRYFWKRILRPFLAKIKHIIKKK